MKPIVYCLLPAVVAAVWPSSALGQKAPASKKSEEVMMTVKFVVHPAAEPRAALKYRLLPDLLDRKPGNAAVLYNKLALLFQQRREDDSDRQLSNTLNRPLAKIPPEELEKLLVRYRRKLDRYRQVLEGLDSAARREHCDWQLPLREQNPLTLLLPELQQTREFARLLSIQARLQIAEGRIEEAIHTLQTGYALGRDVAESPLLVSGLVGVAICRIMDGELRELVQQPGAPNLYWALSTLPRPMIDFRMAFETESGLLYLMFPQLRNVDDTTHRPEYWQVLIDEAPGRFSEVLRSNKPEVGWRPTLAVLAIKGYPQAKRRLVEQGRSPEEVEAMPVAQVVAIHVTQTYDEIRDRMFKWFYLPYWQAREGMDEAEQYLMEGKRQEILPVASLLLPALTNVKLAELRNERQIAMARIVEALRMHGAAHDGKLPARLGEVTEVPIPIDPGTGGPFLYRLEGDTAVLRAPAPPGKSPEGYEIRFEIKFAR